MQKLIKNFVYRNGLRNVIYAAPKIMEKDLLDVLKQYKS